MTIALFSNPTSARNARDPARMARLAELLGARGYAVAPRGLDALATAAAEARARGVHTVVVNGGDGTAHKTLSAVASAWGDTPLPRVLTLCGGTMNTNARSLGMRGEAHAQLARYVALVDAGASVRSVRRSLLVVDDVHYGFLFGVGIIASWLEVYYRGAKPSPAKAALLLLRTAASAVVRGPLIREIAGPYDVSIEADGVPLDGHRWLAAGAGTAEDVGLGFRPFFRCAENPGRMHALGFGCSPAALAGQLPNMWRARPLRAAGIEERVCSSMVLRSDRPLGFMVDGDFEAGGQTVHVRVGPEVELLLPGAQSAPDLDRPSS